MVKYYSVILFLFCFPVLLAGCFSADKEPLGIDFSADSTAIVFSRIDQAGLRQLENAGHPDSILADLIYVLQSPSEKDTAIAEAPVTGHFQLSDSNIVFRPDTLFVRGRDYLVITHLNSSFGDIGKIMEGKLAPQVKPLQKLLSR